ncbi:MAG: hypothetical protein M0Z66_00345 [Thermaerobacter sp.]|nr:hypothetical protein [Thermaerobacter sp.]
MRNTRQSKRRIITIASTLAALGLIGLTAKAPVLADSLPLPNPGMIWMISSTSLDRLASQPGARTLVHRFFGSAQHSILVDGPGASMAPLSATRSVSFASYGALRSHLENRSAAKRSHVVVLDLESWPQTPRQEQRRPALYYRMAGGLARRRGLTLIATPSPNLLPSAPGQSEPIYVRYLDSGLIGQIAAYADVFEVQAQGLERSTALYAQFVAAAADQARDANPHVAVIAGLSTNPGGRAVAAAQLYRDVVAAQPYVDGFWLNIPKRGKACPRCGVPRPKAAVELLRHLEHEKVFAPGAPISTLPS